MTRRFIIGAALAAALVIPRYARGHEGHAHKVMGIVEMRHENHLQVKSADGKAVDITLNEKTRILRGKATVKRDDIKPGARVVVTAIETKGKDAKTTMVATEIKLGTDTPSATKK